jgi:hypothetical protein
VAQRGDGDHGGRLCTSLGPDAGSDPGDVGPVESGDGGVPWPVRRFSPGDRLPQAGAGAASAALDRRLWDGACVPPRRDLRGGLDALDVHPGADPAGARDPQSLGARRRSGPPRHRGRGDAGPSRSRRIEGLGRRGGGWGGHLGHARNRPGDGARTRADRAARPPRIRRVASVCGVGCVRWCVGGPRAIGPVGGATASHPGRPHAAFLRNRPGVSSVERDRRRLLAVAADGLQPPRLASLRPPAGAEG